MKPETEVSLGISAYNALIDQYGMRPRHQLRRLHDQSWLLNSREHGQLRIDRADALSLMALDALVWLRTDIGYEVQTSDEDAQHPERLLRKIRNAVDLVLA